MYAALRRGVSLCTSGVRTYARGRSNRFSNSNPGLGKQAQAFEEAGIDLPQGADLEEMLEESEADMRNMNRAYNQFTEESKEERGRLRHQIVYRKYFAVEMPNLLTWSEKEQIRHLAGQHADEWTPERIAESFPVTPHVVKKLLKYPWKPSSIERIERHDASAMRNWRELKEGTLKIPEELREHFLKFSDRSIPPLKESCIKPVFTKEQIGEFQSIIENCAAKVREKEKNLQEKEKKDVLLIKDETQDSTGNSLQLQSKNQKEYKFDPKRYTLDHLKHKIGRELASGKDLKTSDQIILNSERKDDEVTPISASDHFLRTANKEEKAVSFFQEKPEEVVPVNYPERIKIPKSAYKKGGTYRVNDCYYDYDGWFLYRVPGVS